jgi:hypothetical protein
MGVGEEEKEAEKESNNILVKGSYMDSHFLCSYHFLQFSISHNYIKIIKLYSESPRIYGRKTNYW